MEVGGSTVPLKGRPGGASWNSDERAGGLTMIILKCAGEDMG